MKIIYKYQLEVTAKPQTIRTTIEAPVLHVALQDDIITLWFLEEKNVVKTERTFYLVATGQDIKQEDLWHVGTVFLGRFVWHVFEEKRYWHKGAA